MKQFIYFYNNDGAFVGCNIDYFYKSKSIVVDGDELNALFDDIEIIVNEYDPTKAFKQPVNNDNGNVQGWVYVAQDYSTLTRFEVAGTLIGTPRLIVDDKLIDFMEMLGKWPTDEE